MHQCINARVASICLCFDGTSIDHRRFLLETQYHRKVRHNQEQKRHLDAVRDLLIVLFQVAADRMQDAFGVRTLLQDAVSSADRPRRVHCAVDEFQCVMAELQDGVDGLEPAKLVQELVRFFRDEFVDPTHAVECIEDEPVAWQLDATDLQIAPYVLDGVDDILDFRIGHNATPHDAETVPQSVAFCLLYLLELFVVLLAQHKLRVLQCAELLLLLLGALRQLGLVIAQSIVALLRTRDDVLELFNALGHCGHPVLELLRSCIAALCLVLGL
mmetsp:Transcript_6781/g.18433  ORF Transcript_6781/g.18433 Transcript_6781/m.18433 type:complete len:272 (+) Transcript_6781:260-1075(+)